MIYWLRHYWYLVVGILLAIFGVVCWWAKDYVAKLKSQVRVNVAENEVLRAIDQQKPVQVALDTLVSAKQDAAELETSLVADETKTDAKDKTEGDADVSADLDRHGLK